MAQNMDDLKETVKCSICRNVWTRPKTLPCQHIFCENCLKEHIFQGNGYVFLICPECQKYHIIPREGLEASWPTAQALESLAERFRLMNTPSAVARTHQSSAVMHMGSGRYAPMHRPRHPGNADPKHSDVVLVAPDLINSRMMAGEELNMLVQLRDQDGQIMATKHGEHDIKAFLRLKPLPGGYQPIEIKPRITEEGRCFIIYQLIHIGIHHFTVQLDGIPIKGSPIEFPVIPRGMLGCEIKGPLKGPRDVVELNGSFLVTDGIAKAVLLVDHIGREIKKLAVPDELVESFSPMAIATFQNKVFVTDMGNRCIHVYETLDDRPGQFGHSYLKKPTGVAVSSANGDIFVVDNDLKQIIQFNQSYRYMKAINYMVKSKEDALCNPQMAVINKKGNKLFVADQGAQGNENFIKVINVNKDILERRVNLWMGQRSARPYGIAIDDDDNIYVTAQIDNKSDQGYKPNFPISGNVFVYNSDGHFLGFFRNAQDHLERPLGLTIISSVDPPSSIVYIADSPGKQRDGSLKAFIL